MAYSRNSKADLATGATPSQLIDQRIADLPDWRGETLSLIRTLIHEALPNVVEEWKWGQPVWSHGGILCTGEAYKAAVKTTFPKGASLPDPDGIFNASLEGNARRAIDFTESAAINREAFKDLIRAASSLNSQNAK
jgi:hypothetical protein